MCGIVAYIGNNDFDPKDIKLLMMYNLIRGADSTGIWNNGKITKTTDNCSEFLSKQVILPEKLFLGHTRSKSVGWKKEEQAHPHQYGNIVGVHNGTATNWTEICGLYQFKLVDMDTDSQTIFRSINEGDGIKSIGKFKSVGTALVFIDTKKPNTLYCYKRADRPLWYSKLNNGVYVSSLPESLKAIGCLDAKEFKDDYLYEIHGIKIEKTTKIPYIPYEKTYHLPAVTTHNKHSKVLQFPAQDVELDEESERWYLKNSREFCHSTTKVLNAHGFSWIWSNAVNAWYRTEYKNEKWVKTFDKAHQESEDRIRQQTNTSKECVNNILRSVSNSSSVSLTKSECMIPTSAEVESYYKTIEQYNDEFIVRLSSVSGYEQWKAKLNVEHKDSTWYPIFTEDGQKHKVFAVTNNPHPIKLGIYYPDTNVGHICCHINNDADDPRNINAVNLVTCELCGGFGYDNAGTGNECICCEGAGKVPDYRIKDEETKPKQEKTKDQEAKEFRAVEFMSACNNLISTLEEVDGANPLDSLVNDFDTLVNNDPESVVNFITNTMIAIRSLVEYSACISTLNNKMLRLIAPANKTQSSLIDKLTELNIEASLCLVSYKNSIDRKFNIYEKTYSTTADD